MSAVFSRRGILGVSVGAAAIAALSPEAVKAQNPMHGAFPASFLPSLDKAYEFLNTMMDAYASGSTVRLIQSYSDQAFLVNGGNPTGPGYAVAFTYDNAVVIQAYLARGGTGDLARAQIVGNGLIEAQATNFPFNDGRFAQAYYVNTADMNGAYITPAAFPFYFYTSAVGDQAWAGMALAQLYKSTRNMSYLAAALKVANWIVDNTYSTTGGYSFGTNINQFNQSVPSPNGKSTEHNIDVYAFFTMLSKLTHNGNAANGTSWKSLAQHALLFVQSMFNAAGGFFYTGTQSDGITQSTYPIPEDVQTWSFLALLSKSYGVSLDWVKTNLVTIDTPSSPNSALKGLGNFNIQGETFDTASLAANPGSGADPEAVWLEGTAHTATALLLRAGEADDDTPLSHGDFHTAQMLLANIQLAQAKLGIGQQVNQMPIPAGNGVVSSTGTLDTGFGYDYFPNLHIGATGWYALALQAANPFQLGQRDSLSI